MAKHISGQYDVELTNLNKHFVDMAGLVETQLRDAIQSYLNNDLELAQQVVEREKQVNQYEVDIDIQLASVIARRQPTASDLRLLVALLKSTTDLERVGDESKRIATLATNRPTYTGSLTTHTNVITLQELVVANMARALDAFARTDEEVALQVIEGDKSVDEQYNIILDSSSESMSKDPTKVEECLTIIWIARALERVGDHAKNIGENIVYAVSGRYIKHGKKTG